MITKLSKQLALFFNKTTKNPDQDQEEIIAYGFEVLIYELFIYGLTFLIAFLFGAELLVLFAVLSYSVIRGFASGAHANTRIKCASTYLIIIYLSVLLSNFYFNQYNWELTLFIYSIEMVFLLKYAPGDTIENPFTDCKKIRFKKYFSVISLNILFAVAFIIKNIYPIITNVILFSSFFATLLTTPVMYHILGCKRSYKV